MIIKPNSLHTVCTTADRVSYYCLIVDQSFSNQQKLPLSSLSFQTLVRGDTYIDRIFFELVSEMYEKHDYYKQLVRADVIKLLTHVCRQYQNSSQQPPKRSGNQKDAIVKDIIRYLQHHFTEKISIEQLSHELGFSYSYLCHIFKDVTSLTIVEYIHHLRCNYAMQLLSTMGLSVSEAAERRDLITFRISRKYTNVPWGARPPMKLVRSVMIPDGYLCIMKRQPGQKAGLPLFTVNFSPSYLRYRVYYPT